MDSKNFTIEAQAVIQQAFLIAEGYRHRAVEAGHLLKALLGAEGSAVRSLLARLEKNPTDLDFLIDPVLLAYPKTLGDELYLSLEANRALNQATEFASEISDALVSEEHILVGIASAGDGVASILQSVDVLPDRLKTLVIEVRKDNQEIPFIPSLQEDILLTFTTNLNQEAIHGRLNPVIKREEEINSMMQILSRRIKNNVLLIGDPGVGKTSIVEGLASWIVQEKVPEDFRNRQVIRLNFDRIMTGLDPDEDRHQRVRLLLQRLADERDNILLYFDDAYDIVPHVKNELSDAESAIRTFLLSDVVQVIAVTTLDRFFRYGNKDRHWISRFQPLMVYEPEIKDAVSMVHAQKEAFENFHRVFIPDETVDLAVEWSARFIADRFLPQKAIELIDEAASRVHLEMVSVPVEIIETEQKIATLEVEKKIAHDLNDSIKEDELAGKISALNEKDFRLKARFHLERSIYMELQHLRQQLDKFRKRADLAGRKRNYDLAADLHITRIRETESKLSKLQEKLNGIQQDSPMINVNVTPATLADIISKKTGVPVESIMRDENEMLLHLEDELQKRVFGQPTAIRTVAEVIRRRKAGLYEPGKPVGAFMFAGGPGTGKSELAKALSIILFGSEKMLVHIRMEEYQESHSVSRLIGSLADETSDAENGRLLDFVSKMPFAMVLLTSIDKAHPDVITFLIQLLTLGHAVGPQGRKIRFRNTIVVMTTQLSTDLMFDKTLGVDGMPGNLRFEEATEKAFEVVKSKLPVALINLLEEIVMFAPLQGDGMVQAVRSQLDGIMENLARQNLRLDISEKAMDWFVEKGKLQNDGIRSLKRLIQKHLLNRLSEEILTGRVRKEHAIRIDLGKEGITFMNRSDA